MDITALLLSRIQFAFTITFHIIFPSFTIGLAAWLTVLEALHLCDRAPGLSRDLRVLAEDIRCGIRARRRLRDRDGIPVRHELERAVAGCPGRSRARCCRTRPSPPSCSRRASSASCSLAALACRRGSICFRPRWWRWGPRFRRSGSWSTTAGCRCRSGYVDGKRRLRSERLDQDPLQFGGLGRDFRTCCSPPT